VTGDLHGLLLRLDGAGSGAHDESAAADLDAGDETTLLSLFVSRETSLYGAETGMISRTPGRFSRPVGSTVPRLPVMPIATRWAPGIGVALRPICSTASITRATAAASARESMTMSIGANIPDRMRYPSMTPGRR
jgi:hypothetical protein